LRGACVSKVGKSEINKLKTVMMTRKRLAVLTAHNARG
jgi:hypothetical protein